MRLLPGARMPRKRRRAGDHARGVLCFDRYPVDRLAPRRDGRLDDAESLCPAFEIRRHLAAEGGMIDRTTGSRRKLLPDVLLSLLAPKGPGQQVEIVVHVTSFPQCRFDAITISGILTDRCFVGATLEQVGSRRGEGPHSRRAIFPLRFGTDRTGARSAAMAAGGRSGYYSSRKPGRLACKTCLAGTVARGARHRSLRRNASRHDDDQRSHLVSCPCAVARRAAGDSR